MHIDLSPSKSENVDQRYGAYFLFPNSRQISGDSSDYREDWGKNCRRGLSNVVVSIWSHNYFGSRTFPLTNWLWTSLVIHPNLQFFQGSKEIRVFEHVLRLSLCFVAPVIWLVPRAVRLEVLFVISVQGAVQHHLLPFVSSYRGLILLDIYDPVDVRGRHTSERSPHTSLNVSN